MTESARFDAYVSGIYAEHYRMLVHAMRRYTRDAESAADLAQEAFVRLIAARCEPEYPGAWLRRTGYRLYVDQLRRYGASGRRAIGTGALPAPAAMQPPAATTPEEAWLAEEFRCRAEGLLRQLQRKERLVLHFRMLNHSYRQIAERLSCPPATVRTIARRARLRLLPLLRDDP